MTAIEGSARLYGPGDETRLAALSDGDSRSESYRTPWRRDAGRVLHCPSWRRLCGKTQLFPVGESDFYRNRLTHSLEVGQIAKALAIRLNGTSADLAASGGIEPDICEIAGWCHDLGHPPFGHNGEDALDACMRHHGGFEGNAQTLRILSRLEKRLAAGDQASVEGDGDSRCGLNLTARVLASVVKYDREIPSSRSEDGSSRGLCKGYYLSEAPVVERLRTLLFGEGDKGPLRTIECEIMDLADDIAYSTYDLEDAFKSRILRPIDLLAADEELLEAVAEDINRTQEPSEPVDWKLVQDVLADVFGDLLRPPVESLAPDHRLDLESAQRLVSTVYRSSEQLATNGLPRTAFTSHLVGQFIRSVDLDTSGENPKRWRPRMPNDMQMRLQVLKRFTFQSVIRSSSLQIIAERGRSIVREVFERLADESTGGFNLLPDDVRRRYAEISRDGGDESLKRREICDFVAGMTDRYAVEFWGRLTSEKPATFFKPLS